MQSPSISIIEAECGVVSLKFSDDREMQPGSGFAIGIELEKSFIRKTS